MRIIQEILNSEFFLNQPPVLVDIGASGEINSKWKSIAANSICIAFDADDREFRVNEETTKGYKKLISINRIVTAGKEKKQAFYLTASPFCSSLLEPDMKKLEPWLFQPLFRVERKLELDTITLNEALIQAGVQYIDWFKSDTQGTDLRLYRSLTDDIRKQILAAEFEPGIMDAYKGEDKLHQVMAQMDEENYWLSSMIVKGTQRLRPEFKARFGEAIIKRAVRRSPCWAEVTYLCDRSDLSVRQMLLLYVFALLEKQWGFALELSEMAMSRTDHPIFARCRSEAMKIINRERWKIPFVILKRQFNKAFRSVND